MCKSAATTTSEDEKENVESNNYGLVNSSSSSMATMDLGEIPLVVFLSVVGLVSNSEDLGKYRLTRYLIWNLNNGT